MDIFEWTILFVGNLTLLGFLTKTIHDSFAVRKIRRLKSEGIYLGLTKRENEELRFMVSRLERLLDNIHPSQQHRIIDAIAALNNQIDWSNKK